MVSAAYCLLVCLLADFSSSLVIHHGPQMSGVSLQPKSVYPANSRSSDYKAQRNNMLGLAYCPDGILEQKYIVNPLLQGCPPGFDKTQPNPSNCRTFYNCCGCRCTELTCSDHLLYNKNTNKCDWPEEAGCCEFWEKDPGKLVSDGVFT